MFRNLFRWLFEGNQSMSAALDALTQAVADNTAATNAAVAKIQASVPDDLSAVTAQVTANTEALNAAITPVPPAA